MIPREINPNVKSNAERKVFRLCEKDLGQEWTVLHSVGLVSHKTKPWAEIDFVLIGPPGVFCLEVKGGDVQRKAGCWHFTNFMGETTVKHEGPFEQVGSASAALFRYLTQQDPTLHNVVVGYGVIMPDCRFSYTGPDIETKVLFDERDLKKPFTAYIRRIADFWHERFEASGKKLFSVNEFLNKKILDYIRKDFDLRPSIKTRIGMAKADLLELTLEQYKRLDDLADNERVIIKGGAGTGKTLLAVEESRRQALTGKKVFLCCYNINLGIELKKATEDLPQITAGHLHGFMVDKIKEAGLQSQIPDAHRDDLFHIFYPEFCVEALMNLNQLQNYDVLIIDEGQDLLTESYLEVFEALLKDGLKKGEWKVFYDPVQNIYGGINPNSWKQLSEAHPAKFTLSENCRNTQNIAVATHMISGIEVPKTRKNSDIEVKESYYNDEAQLCKSVSNTVNRLLSEGVKPWEITILGPKRLENSSLKNGLKNVPYPVTTNFAASFPDSRCIRYSTIKAFKGLEADAVILIDVEDLESAEANFDLYVAGTRACAYLEIFLSKKVEEQYQKKITDYIHKLHFAARDI
jgi:Superfamily I DNA and RNA helicases